MMIDRIIDKKKCCGCGACALVCPKRCIEMKVDKEGFLYPNVDEADCIHCGKCRTVCPIMNGNSWTEDNNEKEIYKEPIAIGGWHRNDAIREDSSSGGAFTLFAEYVILKNGVVFGCKLNENNEAVHVGVTTIDGLSGLRKTKYVQSMLGDTYLQIKTILENDKERWVLFVGTPCQVAGLKCFLQKEYKHLYTVDFICHGVPSPYVFQAYISYWEKKKRKKIESFSFRNKDRGWNQSGLQLGTKIEFEDNSIIRLFPAFRDPYMNGFLSDIFLRPSCYECVFKRKPDCYADIKISDFWGVNKICKELNDGKGTSLVLVNNTHGNELWNGVKDRFEHKVVEFDRAIEKNQTIFVSPKYGRRRKKFFDDFQKKGFPYVKYKYMSAISWGKNKIVRMVWNKAEQFIKFNFVGFFNTLISLTVYYLLIYWGINYMLSYTCGFLASVLNAFYWNEKFVFIHKKEQSKIKAFFKTFAAYGFTFILSFVMISVMVEVLGISENIAPVLKLVITTPINFILNKKWAFKDVKTAGR